MAKKTTTLNLTEEEFVHSGNRACSGCGLSIVYRMGLKALGKNTILVVPPSCLTVLQGLYPSNARGAWTHSFLGSHTPTCLSYLA